jgi:universal stress protein E
MKDLRTILAIVDPTAKSQPALARAAWLGEQGGATVELFICDYDPYLAGERFFDTNALEKARTTLIQKHHQTLNKLAKPLREKGLRTSLDVAWDHPLYEGITRKVIETKPALVVKDTHYHTAIRRSIFSNTDWNLIRQCPAPLMLVKPDSAPEIASVVAAVDPVHARDKPAALDHEIIETARTMSAIGKGALNVVHAFDPAPAYVVAADAMSFPIAEPITVLIDGLRQQHERALDELLERYRLDKSCVHLVEGDVRAALLSSVDELNADVVVMGAVSRHAVQRMLLGSTAEIVLDHIPCDLLIVKPGASAA